jgi:hypothetical protein
MFGVAPTRLVAIPEVLFAMIEAATLAGEAVGSVWRRSAAAPATNGAAIEVPLAKTVARSPVFEADMILSPGARISTHAPQSE